VPDDQGQKPRSQSFRANIGIAVLNPDGQVLARAPRERGSLADATERTGQTPQGGHDGGEEPVDTARRELGEETRAAMGPSATPGVARRACGRNCGVIERGASVPSLGRRPAGTG
jgi:hypothetical protein